MSNYWFFLSYAKRDAKDNPWLKRFYKELTSEVARVTGLKAAVKDKDIGFLDEEGIEAGDEWPEALVEALQSSRVFICLYSPSYFGSEYCGKEFEVFRSRVNNYISTLPEGLVHPRLIIPVLWERPETLPRSLPDAVTDIQYTHADFGQLYSQKGLFFLMRMREETAYQQFIMNIAERIKNEAEAHQLPRLTEKPSLKSVNSAFHQRMPAQVSSSVSLLQNVSVPEVKGPEAAWFVYVAGRDIDLKQIRNVIDFYGPLGGRNWRPFLPVSDTKVGLIAQSVATSKGLLNETLPISSQLIDHLREAEATNTIVLIIVDPWSVEVESYQRPMDEYDESRLANCGVIILWNDADNETIQRRDELERTIMRIFSRSSTDTYFRDSVRSKDMLIDELNVAIAELQRKIIKRANVLRPVSNREGTFPRINVPSGRAL